MTYPADTAALSRAFTIQAERNMFELDHMFSGVPYVSVFELVESGGNKWKGQEATKTLTRRYRTKCSVFDATSEEVASGVMRTSDQRVVFYLDLTNAEEIAPRDSDQIHIETGAEIEEFRIIKKEYEPDSGRVDMRLAPLSEQEDAGS